MTARKRRQKPQPRSIRKRRWSGRNSAPTAPSPIISATAPRPTRPLPRLPSVTRIEFVNNRLVCNYMEPRSAIGEWRADEDRFVLTTGSQGVHSMQNILAKRVQDRDGKAARHHAGCRRRIRSEDLRLSRISRWCWRLRKRLGRPVKWAGDRTEHFLTDAQGRDNVVTAEMAMDGDGRFLALQVDLVANIGAYISQYGPFIPYVGATMSTGVYDIQALDVEIAGVYTNTCPGRRLSRRRPAGGGLPAGKAGRCLCPRPRHRPRRNPPPQFHQAGAVSLPHPDRPALRRRRVRRPHDAGDGARRLEELRQAAGGRRRLPERSAASAWRPISRPAPSRARSRRMSNSMATAR